jgi:DNA end-binding protein Ku
VGKEPGRERAVWTGVISFGLVNIPVRLYTATKSHDIAFHQFEEKTGKRIHNKRVVEGGNREVPYEKVVKGYEVQKGKVVLIEPAELAALAPAKMRSIEIEEFVDLHQIDPLYWDTTYFVAPDDRAGAGKSYALFRKAMGDSDRVGIGRFVMRTKEYLVTIRPLGPGLALETMFYADEVRDIDEVIPSDVKKVAAPAQQLALAKQLIDSLSADFDPKRYKDSFRDRVMDLIKKKGRGEEISTEVEEEPTGQVVDLMEALKASLSGRKPAQAHHKSGNGAGNGAKSHGAARAKPTRRAAPKGKAAKHA